MINSKSNDIWNFNEENEEWEEDFGGREVLPENEEDMEGDMYGDSEGHIMKDNGVNFISYLSKSN